MIEKELGGIPVKMPEGMTDEEALAYVERGKKKYGAMLKGIEIRVSCDGHDALLYYDVPPVKFNRLRRITGYLVGDMSRWNNAKRAEEHDRVKHGV